MNLCFGFYGLFKPEIHVIRLPNENGIVSFLRSFNQNSNFMVLDIVYFPEQCVMTSVKSITKV